MLTEKPPQDYRQTFGHFRDPAHVEHYAFIYARAGLLEFEKRLLERHFPPDARRVLVLGAGTGREAPAVDGPGRQVVCVDQSLPMLAGGFQAAGRGQAQKLAADGLALPFKDGSFDALLLFNVYHCLVQGYDPENPHVRLLAECRRVLKKNGTLLLWTRSAVWPHAQLLANLLYLPLRLAKGFGRAPLDVPQWKAYSFHPDPLTREPWVVDAAGALRLLWRELRMIARHVARIGLYAYFLALRQARTAGAAALGRKRGLRPGDCCFHKQWGHFSTLPYLRDTIGRTGWRVERLCSDYELVVGRPPPFASRTAYFACAALRAV